MNKNSKNKIILHEYGARSHYRALTSGRECEFEYVEFAVLKLTVKGLIYRNLKLMLRQIRNVAHLCLLPFLSRRVIVLGMAPFDLRILYVLLLSTKHTIVYHTSWPYWTGNFYPKFAFGGITKPLWLYFLKNRASGIKAVTKTAARSLNEFVGSELDVSVVYHSLDDKFYAKPLRNRTRDGKLKCLFVGRVELSKGLDKIDTLARQLSEYMELTVVGTGNYSFSSNVNRLGFVDSLDALINIYDEHDVLLLPSQRNSKWEELFGMVIIEAMSRGMAVIASKHVGPKEIIEDKVNGLLVSDVNYIAEAGEAILQLHGSDSLSKQLSIGAVDSSKKYSVDCLEPHWDLPSSDQ